MGAAASALALLMLCSCPAPPELSWEGEHLRLGAEDPEAICGGTREYMDRRAGELKAWFGTTHTIDYYWTPSGVAPFCSKIEGLKGCERDSEAFSEWIPHEHEIVHAASTGMPQALEEGLAMHWGDPWPVYEPAPRDMLYPALLQQTVVLGPNEDARLAHFMAYLSETHGRERLAELAGVLSPTSTVDEVNQAFIRVFGVSLDIAVMRYREYPECPGFVDVSLACDKDPIILGPGHHELIRELDCASTDTMGPFADMAFVEEVIELQPTAGGRRVVQLIGDGVDKGGEVSIRRCGPCSETVDEDLPAGRYVVRFYVPVTETPATLGLRITP